MNVTGDIILRHTLWTDAEDSLCKGFIFERLVDLFVVACAIGIKEDKYIENNMQDDDKPKSIGRNTYLVKNEDLTTIITFLFQNAVLNSKTVSFDNDTRLRIAFDPDFPDERSKIQFSPTNFLVKFANYGVSKILEWKSDSDIEYIDRIKNEIDEMLLKDYSDIIKQINEEILAFEKI